MTKGQLKRLAKKTREERNAILTVTNSSETKLDKGIDRGKDEGQYSPNGYTSSNDAGEAMQIELRPPVMNTISRASLNPPEESASQSISQSHDTNAISPPKHERVMASKSTQKTTVRNGIKSSPSSSSRNTPLSPQPSNAMTEKPPPTSIDELRARLATRINEARLARKAPGTVANGALRTREAILEARAKQKARVAEKIRLKKEEMKKKESDVKEEEDSDDSVNPEISFGRVLVDKAEIDTGRGEVKKPKKKKGPSDPKTRLEHILSREEKIKKMDSEKAEMAIENEHWHHALLSARGERVKDDPALLKKTIARKNREKKKSKREWEERLKRVEQGKELRQKIREENIAKRKEETGKKGKKGRSKKVHVKKRPGFEGGKLRIKAK